MMDGVMRVTCSDKYALSAHDERYMKRFYKYFLGRKAMEIDMNRLLHFIGIAYRAGKVSKGAFLTEKMIKNGSALVVIIAGDASENTKDKFISQCKYYGVTCYVAESKEMLGAVSGGADNRSVLAILDEGFAKKCEELFAQMKTEPLHRA